MVTLVKIRIQLSQKHSTGPNLIVIAGDGNLPSRIEIIYIFQMAKWNSDIGKELDAYHNWWSSSKICVYCTVQYVYVQYMYRYRYTNLIYVYIYLYQYQFLYKYPYLIHIHIYIYIYSNTYIGDGSILILSIYYRSCWPPTVPIHQQKNFHFWSTVLIMGLRFCFLLMTIDLI
jgi:diphthamide synthase subunit DPH2